MFLNKLLCRFYNLLFASRELLLLRNMYRRIAKKLQNQQKKKYIVTLNVGT
jgi:hypothetical protein